jgi:hypothetical protein
MAFLASDPSGIHCRTRKYVVLTAMSSGSRIMKRNMWNGRYIPAGVDETGKKGAMPDPDLLH